MAKPRVTVKGQREVVAAFRKVERNVDRMEEVNERVGDLLLPEIRDRTRVQTGTLRSGWAANPKGSRVEFENPLDYAISQEYGTQYVDPTKAVEASFEAHQDDIAGVYADGIGDIARDAKIRVRKNR